jgi:nucleoid-associated protein YgaU
MKNTKTLLLVLTLTGFVPQTVLGQAVPSAAAESKAAPKTAAPVAAAAPAPASAGVAPATPPVAAKSPAPVAEAVPAPVKRAATRPTRRPLAIADNAPSSYTVVKGDTLWGISGKFLKEPWRWPEIWNMNRSQIKDPHWIYPGDVITLTYDANGNPRLSIGANSTGGRVKLSPQIRAEKIGQAIPSIPAKVIGPFLTSPLVIDEGALQDAPRIVGTEDGRVIVGAGNRAYAAGIREEQGLKWQVFRPGKALKDPATEEVLGYEAIYLGDARVSRFGKTAQVDGAPIPEGTSIEIIKSTLEIGRGDRLTPTVEAALPSFVPRSPDKQVKGSVVSILGGVAEGAQYSIVVVGLGKRDGIEVGHVLATSQLGEIVTTEDGTSGYRESAVTSFLKQVGEDLKNIDKEFRDEKKPENPIPAQVKLPDERNGLVFVFRTFEKVSYALVMSSKRQLKVGDVVQTP